MSRCRTLLSENKDLGEQLSQGKSSQLEAELALQKKYGEELKASQDGESLPLSKMKHKCFLVSTQPFSDLNEYFW